MPIPLILALAGTALNEMSKTEQEQALIEAENKRKKLENEALMRQQEQDKKRERQQAMARYLRPPALPAGIGEYEFRPPVVEPDLGGAEFMGGLGRLAQQLGQYYAATPASNTGGQRYYA